MRTTAMAKVSVGVSIEGEFLEACRRARWWIGRGVSLNSILEAGAEAEIAKLEATNGGPFPAREEELRFRGGTPYGKRGEKEAKKVQVIRMEPDLLERLRNAAAALGTNYAGIITDGGKKQLHRLEKQFNNGEPFPPPKKNPV
jgi:hypothetical protein